MDKEKCKAMLKQEMDSYHPITAISWDALQAATGFQTVEKGEILLRHGQRARYIHFICEGAMRAFYTGEDGGIYNKNLFLEGSFSASKVSLLLDAPSYFTIEALEPSIIININFKQYKKLVLENEDLMHFYIAYLEKNWVIEKEQREISLVTENARERYVKLIQRYPDLDKRIAQHHIAAHLGITPTQLSRIRKDLKKMA